MTLDDPAVVRAEYEDETRLAARKAAYATAEGPDAREVAFQAVAVDQSERMVEISRARGVDARLWDAQQLKFPEASFDFVVAAWMLYHVGELDRALAEMFRVLGAGGRLVAVTNGRDHLRELFELLDVDRWKSSFRSEDAASILGRHFSRVERRDAHGWIVFAEVAAAQAYVDSLVLLRGARVPPVDGPIRARRTPSIFVAEKA